MLNSPKMMLSFTGPLPVQYGDGRRPGRLAPSPQDCSTVEAFLPRQYWQKTFVDVFNTYSNICRQQWPF